MTFGQFKVGSPRQECPQTAGKQSPDPLLQFIECLALLLANAIIPFARPPALPSPRETPMTTPPPHGRRVFSASPPHLVRARWASISYPPPGKVVREWGVWVVVRVPVRPRMSCDNFPRDLKRRPAPPTMACSSPSHGPQAVPSPREAPSIIPPPRAKVSGV